MSNNLTYKITPHSENHLIEVEWFGNTTSQEFRNGTLAMLKALGSIRQAAIEMKMSYRQAWQMVESINQKAGTPLVVSQRGGKGGGKAILTEKGERIIQSFNALKETFQQFLLEQSQVFYSEINK